MSEKWILTERELHLGHIKETFGAGAVIEYNEDKGTLVIDGRKFEDTRDLEILKRQANKYPDKPWILPYSEETLRDVLGIDHTKAVPDSKKGKIGEMEVIQSDEDLQKAIDIRDTQVSKRNNEKKEADRDAAKNRDKNGTMEVIRGDEDVNDRLTRLAGKNDLASIAERARLKEKQKMAVVEDDGSCSMAGGSKAAALNAGYPLPSRGDVESRTAQVEAQKEARRREIEAKRKEAGVEGQEPVTVPEVKVESDTSDDIDAQIAALQAKKAAMQDGVDRSPVVDEEEAANLQLED